MHRVVLTAAVLLSSPPSSAQVPAPREVAVRAPPEVRRLLESYTLCLSKLVVRRRHGASGPTKPALSICADQRRTFADSLDAWIAGPDFANADRVKVRAQFGAELNRLDAQVAGDLRGSATHP